MTTRGALSIIRTSTPALEGYILICDYFTTMLVTMEPGLPPLTGRACFLGAADSSYNLKGESFTGCYPPTARYSAGVIGRNLIEARSTTALCRIRCFQSSYQGRPVTQQRGTLHHLIVMLLRWPKFAFDKASAFFHRPFATCKAGSTPFVPRINSH